MADSVILSPTQRLHLICTAVTCVWMCVCVCVVSGIGILTVFHIREGETSECYCKRSTSCPISKNLSLFLSLSDVHTHTRHPHKHTYAHTLRNPDKQNLLSISFRPPSLYLFGFALHHSQFLSLSLISTGLLLRADGAGQMKEERRQALREKQQERQH